MLKRLLTRPVVIDPLGKLYNKDAVIEFFLDKAKFGDGDQICGYLKGVKDVLLLNLTDNPTYSPPSSSTVAQIPTHAPFVCALSLKEMSGAVPFIALRPCGCVFFEAAIRAVIPTLTKGVGAVPTSVDEKADGAQAVVNGTAKKVACPSCTKEFDPTLISSIQPINPPREAQEALLGHLLATRAAAKSSKKRKAAVTDVTPLSVADGETNGDQAPNKAARIHSSSPAPPRPSSASPAPTSTNGKTASMSSTLHKSVHQKLAEQEQKRLTAQAGMSDAVKAMFKPKAEEDSRSGNADFFGRTFNRVSLMSSGSVYG